MSQPGAFSHPCFSSTCLSRKPASVRGGMLGVEKGRAGDQGSGRGHSLFAAFSQFDLLYGQSGSSRILKFPSEFLHHHQVLLGLKGMRPEASFFVVVCFVILFLFLFFFFRCGPGRWVQTSDLE